MGVMLMLAPPVVQVFLLSALGTMASEGTMATHLGRWGRGRCFMRSLVSQFSQLYLEPSLILRTYRFLRILIIINVHPGESLYTSRRPLNKAHFFFIFFLFILFLFFWIY